MEKEKVVAYEKNAVGDFCVLKGFCISCGNPESQAPNLIEHDGEQCFFKKQPTTKEEIEEAMKAFRVCCCGAYHYKGKDKKVLSYLSTLGHRYDMKLKLDE
jgi:hypothetical protein